MQLNSTAFAEQKKKKSLWTQAILFLINYFALRWSALTHIKFTLDFPASGTTSAWQHAEAHTRSLLTTCLKRSRDAPASRLMGVNKNEEKMANGGENRNGDAGQELCRRWNGGWRVFRRSRLLARHCVGVLSAGISVRATLISSHIALVSQGAWLSTDRRAGSKKK